MTLILRIVFLNIAVKKHGELNEKKDFDYGRYRLFGRYLALALKDSWEVIISGRNNKQGFIASKIAGVQSIPMDVSNMSPFAMQ